jgi:hypothetical protein
MLQLPLSITQRQLSEDKFDPDTDQCKPCATVPTLGYTYLLG